MAATLRFFGTAAYELVTEAGTRVLIDPYMDSNPACPVKVAELDTVDLVLVTTTPTTTWARRPTSSSVTAARHLRQGRGAQPDDPQGRGSRPDPGHHLGIPMEVAGVRVHPVESHHWSFSVTPSGELLSGPAMGFMIDAAPGVRVYHQGDSAMTTISASSVSSTTNPRPHGRGAAGGLPPPLRGLSGRRDERPGSRPGQPVAGPGGTSSPVTTSTRPTRTSNASSS